MQCCPETQLTYELKRSSRRQRLALQIRPQGLVVLAPSRLPLSVITAFIKQKQAWIEQHLARRPILEDYLALGQLPLIDDRLQLKVVRDHVTAVTLEGNQLWLQIHHRVTAKSLKTFILKRLSSWYLEQGKLWFSQRLAWYAKQMLVQPQGLTMKSWQSKWGSCDSRGQICLNWRLLLAPQWVSDYVVVHELAHLVHMNHSADFWQLVQQFYPQAQEARLWLRRNQQQLNLTQDSTAGTSAADNNQPNE